MVLQALFPLLAIVVLLSAPTRGHSQMAHEVGDYQEIIVAQTVEGIQARATKLREIRALLLSADPLLRRAAIEESLQSDDPAVVKMAYDVGFSSDDPEVRTTTLAHWLASRKRINLDTGVLAKPTPDQSEYLERNAPLWFTKIKVTSDGQIEMTFRDQGLGLHVGSLVPGGLVVTSRFCSLNLNVTNETQLSGSYRCGKTKPFPVTVRLN